MCIRDSIICNPFLVLETPGIDHMATDKHNTKGFVGVMIMNGFVIKQFIL